MKSLVLHHPLFLSPKDYPMKTLMAVSFFTVNFCYSQQTENLRLIKEKYDSEVKKTETRHQKDIRAKNSKYLLEQLTTEKNRSLNMPLSQRYHEYSDEVSKIKPIPFSLDSIKVVPVYPKGIVYFKNEISNNFYANEIDAQGTVTSKLTFIIERDGSITEVKAEGSNETFITYATVAVYLTQYIWQPARINGRPVRYRFSIPLTLTFN